MTYFISCIHGEYGSFADLIKNIFLLTDDIYICENTVDKYPNALGN